MVEEKESLLDIFKDLAEQGIVDNAYLFAISLRCMNGYENIRPGSRGTCRTRSEPVRRWCYMSTYEELQLIVSVAVLIVTILDYTHKK